MKPDGQFYSFFNDTTIFKDCIALVVDDWNVSIE
jgi:hypothetical protein